MSENLKIKLQLIEETQQVQIVCAETGRVIGNQASTIVESKAEEDTYVTVVFQIRSYNK